MIFGLFLSKRKRLISRCRYGPHILSNWDFVRRNGILLPARRYFSFWEGIARRYRDSCKDSCFPWQSITFGSKLGERRFTLGTVSYASIRFATKDGTEDKQKCLHSNLRKYLPKTSIPLEISIVDPRSERSLNLFVCKPVRHSIRICKIHIRNT